MNCVLLGIPSQPTKNIMVSSVMEVLKRGRIRKSRQKDNYHSPSPGRPTIKLNPIGSVGVGVNRPVAHDLDMCGHTWRVNQSLR
jgi:hypothetical protein